MKCLLHPRAGRSYQPPGLNRPSRIGSLLPHVDPSSGTWSVTAQRMGRRWQRPNGPGPRLEVVLRLGFAVIGVVDMPRAVAFWTVALNLVASEEWQNDDWVTLCHADGSGRALGLQRSQSSVEAHPRIHLDLFVDTTAEQESEVERLVGLGATKLDWGLYPPEPDFIVLGDPDGNPFCIVDLSQAPSGGHGSS